MLVENRLAPLRECYIHFIIPNIVLVFQTMVREFPKITKQFVGLLTTNLSQKGCVCKRFEFSKEVATGTGPYPQTTMLEVRTRISRLRVKGCGPVPVASPLRTC